MRSLSPSFKIFPCSKWECKSVGSETQRNWASYIAMGIETRKGLGGFHRACNGILDESAFVPASENHNTVKTNCVSGCVCVWGCVRERVLSLILGHVLSLPHTLSLSHSHTICLTAVIVIDRNMESVWVWFQKCWACTSSCSHLGAAGVLYLSVQTQILLSYRVQETWAVRMLLFTNTMSQLFPTKHSFCYCLSSLQ